LAGREFIQVLLARLVFGFVSAAALCGAVRWLAVQWGARIVRTAEATGVSNLLHDAVRVGLARADVQLASRHDVSILAVAIIVETTKSRSAGKHCWGGLPIAGLVSSFQFLAFACGFDEEIVANRATAKTPVANVATNASVGFSATVSILVFNALALVKDFKVISGDVSIFVLAGLVSRSAHLGGRAASVIAAWERVWGFSAAGTRRRASSICIEFAAGCLALVLVVMLNSIFGQASAGKGRSLLNVIQVEEIATLF
jgi:hypothetical protein